MSTLSSTVLILALLIPAALRSADTVPDTRPAASPLPASETYRRAVEKYNSHVLKSGSALGEEAAGLKADMEALRIRGEKMRRPDQDRFGPLTRYSATDPSGEEMPPPKKPTDPAGLSWGHLALEILVCCAVIGLLAFICYRAQTSKRGGGAKGKRVVIKCPQCGRKLRVPKSEKRVRVRCPDCGKECAYNPHRAPGKARKRDG